MIRPQAFNYGNLYLRLSNHELTRNKLLSLLTSLNPQERLVGFLLYKKSSIDIPYDIIKKVENSNYKFRFRDSSLIRGDYTANEIKKHLFLE